MSTIRLPGLIDIHTHLREPGLTHKEDFRSGTRAAIAGGFTMLLDMPNTIPPTSTDARFSSKAMLAAHRSTCDVGLFLGATEEDIGAYRASAVWACGLKIYVNETFGSLRIDTLQTLHEIFRGWAEIGSNMGYRSVHNRTDGIGPIAVHAEEMMVPLCIGLAHMYDVPLHVVHVSRRSEIEVIRRAKDLGWKVTCEVTPHHLLLTSSDKQRLGAIADMRPRLAEQDDVDSLWENLDYVDAFATDHAPHTLDEKQSSQPPPGIPGLESMLPLLLTLVHDGKLELEDIVRRCYDRPKSIFGLPEQQDTYVVVDVDESYAIDPSCWQSKAQWSPFAGRPVRGRVKEVVIRGQTLVADGVVQDVEFHGKVLFQRPSMA